MKSSSSSPINVAAIPLSSDEPAQKRVLSTRLRICRSLSRALVILGLVMLLANLVNKAWLIILQHDPRLRSVEWAPGVDTADAEGPKLSHYLAFIREGGAFDLADANRRVHTATIHSDYRRIAIHENWLQYLLGLCYEPLSHTQDSSRLMTGGIGNCSERSQILKSICESAGHRCRFCGLGGHVVLEVMVQGRWHTADPDYGIEFAVPVKRLAAANFRPMIRGALMRQGHSKEVIDQYLEIVESKDDNRTLGVGTPLSPRLYLIERACVWLTWIIPALLILTGYGLGRKANNLAGNSAAVSAPSLNSGSPG